MELSPGISVVVPVYNSEQSLPILIDRLHPVLSELHDSYEVLLVNDGSRDNSWDVIEQLAVKYSWVSGINLMRNFGQHNALLCGIRAANYKLTVTMDDDLQNRPEELPKLLDRIKAGYDVVYGTPQKRQHGFMRNMASLTTKFVLQRSMGVEIATKVSAYRLFHTQLRAAFDNYHGAYISIDALLTWGTTRFSSVAVQSDIRQFGASNYTFLKLVRHFINSMTSYTTLPLQLASMLGFFFVLFGIGILVYVIGRFAIEGGSAPGFPFLASTIAIFSGVQLFALGIIGEYLARMHMRLMDRPSYVIREQVHPTDKREASDV